MKATIKLKLKKSDSFFSLPNRAHGFTLVEMLLVLVIVGFIIYASLGYFQQKTLQMRMDRTSIQMQQILNAGLAYYVANGKWPTDIDNDLKGKYLPDVTIRNPWNQAYTISVYSPSPSTPSSPKPPPSFYVTTAVTAATTTTGSAMAAANVIAGLLPFGYSSTTAPTPTQPPDATTPCAVATQTCYITSSVSIPGQNLNNARAINFAGLYHHGGCVPVPQCPVDSGGATMTPQIMVVPVSVSGLNDSGKMNIYPISSFTAFATSNTNGTPDNTNPPGCPTPSNATPSGPSCTDSSTTIGTASAYWRVCLQVVTEKGDVAGTNTSGSPNVSAWGENATLLALTRCAVNNEPSGSTFKVFSN